MLRLDASTKTVAPLERQAELRARSFFDRYALHDFLAHSPHAIFADAGIELLAVASGEYPFAVDPDGRVYIIAAQKGGRRPDLSQALEQASRIATSTPKDILRRVDLVEREELSRFLRVPIRELNRTQGVVLVAESFDEGALQTILWLHSRYGLHVSCVALTLLVLDNSNKEFISTQMSTLDSLRGQPDRLLIVEATSNGDAEGPASSPVRERHEAPEWRGDFAAVFDQTQGEEDLGGFPRVDVMPPTEEPSVSEKLGALFDEPQAADDAPLEANGDERRTAPRSPDYHARRLRLDYQGRLIGARLVDFSEAGLGVEVLSALPIGSEVAVSGEVSGDDGVYSITGSVVVAHCLSRQDGVCRIGFSLEKATIQRVSSPPEDFDRR